MNPKIQELAEQAGMIIVDDEFSTHGKFAKKFAELLIRECLSDLKERIALRYQGSDKDCDIGYGMEIVYYEIVDKFGVEV
jgi:hypothetical protein